MRALQLRRRPVPLGARHAIFPRWELSQVPFGDHAGCPLGDKHDRGWQFPLQFMLLPFWEMLRTLRPSCIDVEASFSAGASPNGPTREKSRHRRRTSRQPAWRFMGSGRSEHLQNSVACRNLCFVKLVGLATVADACAPKALRGSILACT